MGISVQPRPTTVLTQLAVRLGWLGQPRLAPPTYILTARYGDAAHAEIAPVEGVKQVSNPDPVYVDGARAASRVGAADVL